MAKLPYTPNSIIKSAMRKMWMRSRERAAALKSTGYCCAECGVKQSKAKGHECTLDVHHFDEIDWEALYVVVRKHLLVDPKRLTPLCRECHNKETM